MKFLPKVLTIVEFLVVVLTITSFFILATIFVGTGHPRCKLSSLTLEVNWLGSAIEDFKNEHGSYPPNLMVDAELPVNSEQNEAVQQNLLRAFKKAFPRSEEPESLLMALAGEVDEVSGESQLPGGMAACEAIFFWLGGFSSDPQYPLSGPGGPSFSDAEGNNDGVLDGKDESVIDRNLRFEFTLRNLGPKNKDETFNDRGVEAGGGRYVEYDDPRDGSRRRIHLWQYFPGTSEVALVYFDVSRHDPLKDYPVENSQMGTNVCPVCRVQESEPEDTPATNRVVFANQGKFQLLHAGLDETWGDFSKIRSRELVLPEGPFVGALADTVSNLLVGPFSDERKSTLHSKPWIYTAVAAFFCFLLSGLAIKNNLRKRDSKS